MITQLWRSRAGTPEHTWTCQIVVVNTILESRIKERTEMIIFSGSLYSSNHIPTDYPEFCTQVLNCRIKIYLSSFVTLVLQANDICRGNSQRDFIRLHRNARHPAAIISSSHKNYLIYSLHFSFIEFHISSRCLSGSSSFDLIQRVA